MISSSPITQLLEPTPYHLELGTGRVAGGYGTQSTCGDRWKFTPSACSR